MKSLDAISDAGKMMAVGALALSLTSADSAARCGELKVPINEASVAGCLSLQPGSNFKDGLSSDALKLLESWGFTVTENVLSHPEFGKLTYLSTPGTEGVWSQHINKDIPTVRIFVRGPNNVITRLDIYKVKGTIWSGWIVFQMPSISTFKK